MAGSMLVKACSFQPYVSNSKDNFLTASSLNFSFFGNVKCVNMNMVGGNLKHRVTNVDAAKEVR